MSQFEDKFIHSVVRKYSDMIIRIAFQHTQNRADAEDIMQDVFCALLKQPPFESDQHLKAWLIRVSINKSRDYLRARKRRQAVTPPCNYALTDEQSAVFEQLQLLPEKDRNILYLFYYEGYSAREIATILGNKESAVFMRLCRAREKLKCFLEDEG